MKPKPKPKGSLLSGIKRPLIGAKKSVTLPEEKEKVKKREVKAERKEAAKPTAHKRELTGHVVTRHYRPPEVILLEKEYDGAIDVWSVGCIFAELLAMIEGNSVI